MDLDAMLRSPQARHHLCQPATKRALRSLLHRVRTAGQLLPQPEPSAATAAGAPAAAAECLDAATAAGSDPAPAAQPQWVHGDLRLANILGPADGGGEEPALFLIDYDWAGVANQSVYESEDISIELADGYRRPAGVTYKGIMCTQRDVETLETDYSRCEVKLGASPDSLAMSLA